MIVVAATQIHSSLLSISVGAVLLPAAFHFALTYDMDDEVSASTSLETQKQSILKMSRGVRLHNSLNLSVIVIPKFL